MLIPNPPDTATLNLVLIERAEAILERIEFQGYSFIVNDGHGGVYLRAMYQEPDIYTKKMGTQYTRKWLLSPEMTESEIVQTAFKLCMTSMEHRTREGFLYHGRRIFGPHFDVQDLWRLCDDREAAGGRQ